MNETWSSNPEKILRKIKHCNKRSTVGQRKTTRRRMKIKVQLPHSHSRYISLSSQAYFFSFRKETLTRIWLNILEGIVKCKLSRSIGLSWRNLPKSKIFVLLVRFLISPRKQSLRNHWLAMMDTFINVSPSWQCQDCSELNQWSFSIARFQSSVLWPTQIRAVMFRLFLISKQLSTLARQNK